MPAYLLTYNPKYWVWEDLPHAIAEIAAHGYHESRWSCGRSKRIKAGDRVFLMQQGAEPRGIFGAGEALADAYQDEQWNAERWLAGSKTCMYVEVAFDALIDPTRDPILTRERLLTEPPLCDHHWDVRTSGTRIPDPVTTALEAAWARTLARI